MSGDSPAPTTAPPGDLESVRSELRRLGYLDRGFERFLLQDALRPQPPLRALLTLTGKLALAAGLTLAPVLALGLAYANGNLAASPWDLVPLFLHLFLPVFLATAAGFLVLCGGLLAVHQLHPKRRAESLSLAAAVLAGAAGLGLALWHSRDLVADAGLGPRAAFGLAAAAVTFLIVRWLYQGLLGLAIRLGDAAPRTPFWLSRRGFVAVLLPAAFLLALPAVFAARREPPEAPASLPTAPGERVLLLGIDGVLPAELEYLLKAGELPQFSRLLREGGRLAGYARRDELPASFWTSVATGRPTPEHGVAALDSFLPRGVRTPLARSGPLRGYWRRFAVPLGLAEYRPVLANRRKAFTVWELASRGGVPVLAVNWWATFPAEPLPGLVVAHGAYQLLGQKADGVVEPPAERAQLEREAAEPGPEPFRATLNAALPAAEAEGLAQRSLRPDLFYRRIFGERLAAASRPRAAALYLPGLDIAAADWRGGAVAWGDLIREELAATDALLPEIGDFGTVAVVFDPGRRQVGGEGRVLLWRRQGCRSAPAGEARTTPEAVAAGLLRALGLPQSAELPAPPALCAWPEAPVGLAAYGTPRQRIPIASERSDYLENLRSLGYL